MKLGIWFLVSAHIHAHSQICFMYMVLFRCRSISYRHAFQTFFSVVKHSLFRYFSIFIFTLFLSQSCQSSKSLITVLFFKILIWFLLTCRIRCSGSCRSACTWCGTLTQSAFQCCLAQYILYECCKCFPSCYLKILTYFCRKKIPSWPLRNHLV